MCVNDDGVLANASQATTTRCVAHFIRAAVQYSVLAVACRELGLDDEESCTVPPFHATLLPTHSSRSLWHQTPYTHRIINVQGAKPRSQVSASGRLMDHSNERFVRQ